MFGFQVQGRWPGSPVRQLIGSLVVAHLVLLIITHNDNDLLSILTVLLAKKMSPQVTTYTSSIRTQLAPSTASTPGTATSSEPAAAGAATSATSTSVKNEDDDAGKKKKTVKRRKVNHACLYCRRSHMTCDEGRPCQRWRVLESCL